MAIPGTYGYLVFYVRQGLCTQVIAKRLGVVLGEGAVLERGTGLGSASFIADKVIPPSRGNSPCGVRPVGASLCIPLREDRNFRTPSSHSARVYIRIAPTFCRVGYFGVVLRSCFLLPVCLYMVHLTLLER